MILYKSYKQLSANAYIIFQLFWTPLYDTLPIEAVVGRCAVLDASAYVKGRPRHPAYRESDVYICEFKVDKSQRLFERITSKQKYYLNTAPYAFALFPHKTKITRNFTVSFILKCLLTFRRVGIELEPRPLSYLGNCAKPLHYRNYLITLSQEFF